MTAVEHEGARNESPDEGPPLTARPPRLGEPPQPAATAISAAKATAPSSPFTTSGSSQPLPRSDRHARPSPALRTVTRADFELRPG
jgi:hypothetical protein